MLCRKGTTLVARNSHGDMAAARGFFSLFYRWSRRECLHYGKAGRLYSTAVPDLLSIDPAAALASLDKSNLDIKAEWEELKAKQKELLAFLKKNNSKMEVVQKDFNPKRKQSDSSFQSQHNSNATAPDANASATLKPSFTRLPSTSQLLRQKQQKNQSVIASESSNWEIFETRFKVIKQLESALEAMIKSDAKATPNDVKVEQKETVKPQHDSNVIALSSATLKALDELAALKERSPNAIPAVSKEQIQAQLNDTAPDEMLATLKDDFAQNKAFWICSRLFQQSPVSNPNSPSLSEPLRHLMRSLPAPIVVLTTTLPNSATPPSSDFSDHYRGMTLSSFTSFTLSPTPIVTFNIRSTHEEPSRTFTALKECSHFLIHLLDSTPEGARIADIFTRGNVEDVFKKGEKEGVFEVRAYTVQEKKNQMVVSDDSHQLPMLHGSGVRKVLRCSILHNDPHSDDYIGDIEERQKGLIRVGDHVLVMANVIEILDGDESEEEYRGSYGLSYADGTYRQAGEVIDLRK